MMSISGESIRDTKTQLLNELKDKASKTERSMKKPKYSMNEDIAVSGISGRYPESDDVEEFSRNLYDNINLISDDERRWPRDFYGLPAERGKIKDIYKFDSNFFGVSDLEAEHMDPQIRIMLELTYEAIWDSGTDPNLLIESNTGVFIGNCYDEYCCAYSKFPELINYKQFMAQTISQKFNFNGPSIVIDTACASSFSALNEAVIALRNNRCDNAIVAGLNIALNPLSQWLFYKLNMISPEGKCKCLDESANGYAKGEGCVVILLQKQSVAKRVYVTIIHSKTNNDGYKEMGITYPSWETQRNIISETYLEAGINPLEVQYVESHCTGTKAGDPPEMQAICESMCTEGRKNPLLIGALKSNTGHTEAASGLCALTKVILSLENECIPANLHFNKPNPEIEGLMTGVLKPINKNTPFYGDVVGLNNFGFGGSNIHVIVKSPKKSPTKENKIIIDKIPRLVLMCGRNEESINHFFKSLLNNPKKITRDVLALINDISKTSPFQKKSDYKGMRLRGFTILDESNDKTIISTDFKIKKVSKIKKDIWFVFSGMGTQWSAMAKSLINIGIFSKSINFSSDVLTKYGIDLWRLLTEDNQNFMDSALNAFITIAAIQIAFVDLLNELDIKPDGIIGHSIGEVVCAYADGCITAEETILIAYWRGKCIEECIEKKGMMAAVGMGWDEIQLRCPPNVFFACDNAEDSVTISGEKKILENFITDLKKEDICTANVDTCGFAFHSPLIHPLIKPLYNKLKNIITAKRMISSKWISTTYNNQELSKKQTQYLSAQYFVDNLIFPVQFYSALKLIPNNAVIIEISPHNLLQSIIKRCLGSDIFYIPLMKKNSDNLKVFLESIGNLYSLGFNTSIEKIYPNVVYPVSNGTLMISPLIKWDHKINHKEIKYPEFFSSLLDKRIVRGISVDLMYEEYSYISGHKIDGKILFPATGYLMIVWKQLAEQMNTTYDELPVEFRDVVLHRATLIPNERNTIFSTSFDNRSDKFVITQNKAVVVTGKIFALKEKPFLKFDHMIEPKSIGEDSQNYVMQIKDIYKELRLRGYDYGKSFQCMTKAKRNDNNYEVEIEWRDNWVTFADCMLQIGILGMQLRGLLLPVRINFLRCDPKVLLAEVKALGNIPKFRAIYDYDLNIGVTKGLEYQGVKANLVQRNLNLQKAVVGNYEFCPFNQTITYENERHLLEYSRSCNRLAKCIVKNKNISLDLKAEKINQFKYGFNDYDNDDFIDIEKKKLHEFLKDIIEHDFTYDINANEDDIKLSDLERDLITESFNSILLFDSLVAVVFENRTSRLMEILEINESSTILYSNVMKTSEIYDNEINLKYSLLHPNPHKLQSNLMNGLKIVECNFNNLYIPDDIDEKDLIIYRDNSVSQISKKSSADSKQVFKSIWNKLKPNGFLLVICRDSLTFAEKVICKLLDIQFYDSRKNEIISEAEKIGFISIGNREDIFKANALLFRKILIDVKFEKQVFIHISEKFELWIENLKNEMKSIHLKPEGENIWLIADEKPTNGIIGFFNCLKRETNGERVRCIFNFNSSDDRISSKINGINSELHSILRKNLLINVMHNNKLGNFIMRKIESIPKEVETEYCYLNVRTKGDLSSLKWFESEHKYWPIGRKTNEVFCNINYSALNFRDIMLATGRLPADALPGDMALHDCILGMEFSGRDENGNRVMGMIPSKALATTCIVEDIDFLWPIPQHWSMEEAATVPVVYTTAYYALIIRGHLKRGEKVLVHSGSGGVGQAAINICLSLDCHVFVTVGSDVKRDFLKKLFPKLCDRNFSSSRDLSFKTHVMNETNGLGVDVILNSLSEDKLKASLECLANNGRFLEIGKYDMSLNTELNTSELLRNKTIHGILLDTLFIKGDNTPKIVSKHRKMLQQLIQEGVINGTVKPLNRHIFNIDESEKAFRYMSSGKHMGKVLIKIKDEDMDNMISKPLRMSAIPRIVFYPNKSYIITGGLGGMGLELINWMIERGAKQFVITSRTGPKEPYQYIRLKYFAEKGVNVIISTEDLSALKGAKNLLKMALNIAQIGGIFHLSMILSDGLFENQTIETFNKVFSSKSSALINLDIISRKLCPDIDYFVAYSSLVSSRGNVGQTNYGFTNSVMDRICDLRRSDGLHALSIHWGVIGDVGYVAKNITTDEIEVVGTVPQRTPSVLSALERLLHSDHSIGFSFVKSQGKSESSETDLMKRVAHILGLEDYTKLDLNTKLVTLGMDSLMGVEIKQIIERDFDLILSPQDIQDLTIKRIKEINFGNLTSKQTETLKSEKIQAIKQSIFCIPTEDFTLLNDIREGKHIFFLPPTDGTYDLFNSIAMNLNRPVIGINWTLDFLKSKSIEELANNILVLIAKVYPNIDMNFDLIGYSYGGVVAYEMCLQLQQEFNRFPKLILLDSSPVQFKLDGMEALKSYSTNSMDEENILIGLMIKFLMDKITIQIPEVQSILRKTPKEDRIKKVSQIFLDSSGIDCDLKAIEFAVELHSNNLLMTNKYPQKLMKMNGNLLLIRATQHVINESHTDHTVKYDYGLSEVVNGKCDVVLFDGNHETYLVDNGEKIVESIAKYLDLE